MLVIVIHRFFYIFKMLCQHKIRIAQGVVLIKNILGKPETVLYDHRTAEDFHNQASSVQNQAGTFLPVQNPALAFFIIRNHLACLHGMPICQAIITARQIRAGAFRLFDQTFIHIVSDPVIAVDKSDPIALRHSESDVFRPSLMFIHLRMDGMELLRETRFITFQYLKGMIGGTIVYRDDLIILHRLADKGIQAIFQFSVRRHIINRHNNTKLHNLILFPAIISRNLSYRPDHIFHIPIRHGIVKRKADNFFI